MIPGDRDFWFLPLGGCGEIGMNLNLYGHAGAWLMVDCGITFERRLAASRPRIQTPDPRFIADRRTQLAGIVLTHAHEDHIGALPLLWKRFPVPVYTTPFTAELLRQKAAGRGGTVPAPLIECVPMDRQRIGPFDVQWLPITHSTPDTCALLLRTEAGKALHTADWKVDSNPQIGDAFDAALFSDVGRRGLDAVVCDSTNAPDPGFSPSEGEVFAGLKQVVAERRGRIVATCFASNVARLHSLKRVAAACDRYTALLGRSLHTVHDAALRTGLLRRSKGLIDASHVGYLPPEEVLAIATGSQGEPGAALQRLAMDTHPHLSLDAGDTVIFSARIIPGNEEPVHNLLTRFRDRGIEVLTGESVTLHASGHPCAGELEQMYRSLKPRLAVPVHGEAEHMAANARIARGAGVNWALTGNNGDLFYLAPEPGVRRRVASVGRLQLEADGTLRPVTENPEKP